MQFEVVPTPRFEKDIKYYQKKKHYSHILDDVDEIVKELENGNFIGDEIPGISISIDNHVYKVRSANRDANVGQSNGYRIIYYVIKDDSTVFLLTIYSKKDDNNIPSNSEIAKIVTEYCID